MKILLSLVASVLLSASAASETYQCMRDEGCPARINRDGELVEEQFRSGDMVQTESGYIVSTDDGWKLVQTKPFRPRDPQVPSGGASAPIVVISTRPAVLIVHGIPVVVAPGQPVLIQAPNALALR